MVMMAIGFASSGMYRLAPLYLISGLYSVVCGLWAVGCGLWAVGCGLWAVGYGL